MVFPHEGVQKCALVVKINMKIYNKNEMATILTHNQISEAISLIMPKYDVKSVSYFGSYANGSQTQDSDLDLLVEFRNPFISLYELIGLEMEIEAKLHIPIDIATYPPPKGSRLIIEKAVKVYGY